MTDILKNHVHVSILGNSDGIVETIENNTNFSNQKQKKNMFYIPTEKINIIEVS